MLCKSSLGQNIAGDFLIEVFAWAGLAVFLFNTNPNVDKGINSPWQWIDDHTGRRRKHLLSKSEKC
jgi:hypothetical protein